MYDEAHRSLQMGWHRHAICSQMIWVHRCGLYITKLHANILHHSPTGIGEDEAYDTRDGTIKTDMHNTVNE